MEVFKLPPNESIGTRIPVFPNGRVGTVRTSSEAWAECVKLETIVPAPAKPVAFKKSRRDKVFLFFNTF
jgi:hypothetical protein